MKKTEFRIPKMDCPSEESLIRLKLEEVHGIKNLIFEIPDRMLIVHHECDSQEVLSALQPLNFGAKIVTSAQVDSGNLFSSSLSDKEETSLLIKLLVINGVMFLVEFAAGLIADSMGLISDSLDMLADASVYLVSLYAVGKTLSVKKKSARVNGFFQLILGIGVLIETVRKLVYGSDPEPSYMVIVSVCALAANVYCLYLLSKHKDGEVHMKASYICSSTDVMANTGVVLAGAAVYFFKSPLPDLFVGVMVTVIVLRGALLILRISK
ncbi:MAG: cation transporter [Bacteriovoracaceae bacterium]